MRTKRNLSVLILFALLLTAIAPFAAFAEGNVAKIGDTGYASIAEAVAALRSGDTLELLANADAGTAQLTVGVSAVIKGNGYTLTSANTDYAIVLGDNAGKVVLENIEIKCTAGGGFKIMKNVTLEVADNVKMNTKNCAFLFHSGDGKSEGSSIRIRGGEYVSAGGFVNCTGNNVTGRSVRIDGGSYTASGGNLVAASNATVEVYGGVFRNQGPSNNFNFFGQAELKMYGGAIFNDKADAGSAVLNLNENSFVTIYDGYFCNNGKGRALTTNGSAGEQKDISIYGGTFVVKGTGAAVRSDDSKRPVVVYGGQFFNYANNWAVAGQSRLKGGYVMAVKALADGGSVTENTAARNEAGGYLMTDGLYARVADTAPTMLPGASARLVEGSNGIRFEATVSKATVDYVTGLKDEGTEIGYGTVICPTDLLAGISGMNMNALTVMGKAYENVVAKDGISTDADGNVRIRAALVDLKTENIGRAMSAVSYISYVKNGTTVYVYGAYAESESSRSMSYVANAALNDVKSTATGLYKYEYNGKYSPYTDAQRAILQGYLDAVAN